MNEKWVGMWLLREPKFLIIKKTELLSANLGQVADRARVADPLQAGNLWRSVALDMKMTAQNVLPRYVDLQPGNSSQVAVAYGFTIHSLDDNKFYPMKTFKIFSLDTGEVLCQISNMMDLFFASWWGDAYLFLKKVQSGKNYDSVKLQLVTFDISQRNSIDGDEEFEKIQKKSTYLLPGPLFEFPAAPKLEFHSNSDHRETKMHVDYSGLVIFSEPNLFFAAID
jgi:hypothetical protein